MDQAALQPINEDGFETGDYRNFAPVYRGDESEWIRPTATVTSENPITGDHSLRWTANEDPHRWALVSNAFHLASPLTATVSIRVDGPTDEPYSTGLGIAETQDRAAVARITESAFELTTETWLDVATTADIELTRGEIYELSLALAGDGTLTAVVRDGEKKRAELQATTSLDPNALALTVDTVADGETTLTFDDVSVDASEFRVKADEWARSPQFVVLPRTPDVGEDQGNWVGAASVIDEDDRYRMWYRIRNNESRGAGFGIAESQDGLVWEKSDENPVLTPDYGQDSNEGLSVLKVDGTYRTWYTINRDGTWHIVHATSDDGVDWTDHGIVIEGYCKDPVVLYVGGTYYMYAIAPSNTEFGIYTSDDGRDWTLENTIDFENHGHPGAYYVEETETFWLYAFAEEGQDSPPASVRQESSDDGIHFDDLEPTWRDPPIGLDHRPAGGIDYGAFPGDGHGHIEHDRRVPMFYQARHDYHNNRPGWHKAGDGKVVLGGRFSGLFESVPTTVGDGGYAYHGFPMHAVSIPDLDLTASEPATVTIERWTVSGGPVARGTIETTDETTVTISVTELDADRDYTVVVGDDSTSFTTDEDGTGTIEVDLPADASKTIELTAV